MNYIRRFTDTTIEIEPAFPKNPRPAETDELMRQISAKLGRSLGAVKLGGYWVIGEREPVWRPLTTGEGLPRTRSLLGALHVATGRTVVQSAPQKGNS